MGERMRVGLFVTAALLPPETHEMVSGHVRIALRTAEILLEGGYEVTVFTTEGKGTLPLQDASRIHVVALPLHTLDYSAHRPLQAGKQFAQLWRHLRRGSYHVFHTFGAGRVSLQAALLRALGAVKHCVVSVTTPSERRLQHRLARFALAQVDAVVAMTETAAADLRQMGIHRVVVARPGITKDVTGGRRLFPGRTVLYWRYGTEMDCADLCLSAFDTLAAHFGDTQFVFAVPGWSPFLKAMTDLAARHPNVHVFTVPYPSFTTRDLLASADVCVLPFREPSLHPQLTLLECLHSGTPVITTSVGSNPEVLRGGAAGVLLDKPTAAGICDAVRVLLEDNARRLAYAREATAAAREWNWSEYRNRMMELYGRLKP